MIAIFSSIVVELLLIGGSGQEVVPLVTQPDTVGVLRKPDVLFAPMMRSVEPGTQCGIYSLYAAARAMNKDVSIEQLLDRKYVESFHGSTAKNLILGANDLGLSARFVAGLDIQSLRGAKTPVLLQYHNSHAAEQTLHWVAYLGDDDGQARIYDAPHEIESVSYAQLQTVWNGNGIVIGDNNASRWLELSARARAVSWLWPIACFCLGVRLAKGLRKLNSFGSIHPSLSLGKRVAVVTLLVVAWGFWVIRIDPHQPIANPLVTNSLKCDRSIDERPHVSEIANGSVVIDCRLPLAFGFGNIPGSINVPIDASFNEWNRAVDGLDRGVPIVVYCQSDHCGWADRVATRLACHGFKSAVLEGGYDGFIEKSGPENLIDQANRLQE
jgi:rhodanese-related sulfurtransferase